MTARHIILLEVVGCSHSDGQAGTLLCCCRFSDCRRVLYPKAAGCDKLSYPILAVTGAYTSV